ncbi:MAG: 39S ribosomal protein L45 [Desulfovibrio sp.]|jgi:predicted lipid-binding transport protein (Tim44 family)|nr:39S ribosomal protein L45 [Desulfovibrio sp.]
MRIHTVFLGLLILFAALTLILPDTADAARMGGGKSFGGKPFMSTPAAPPSSASRQPQANTRSAQPGQAAAAPRTGMFGGMGGIFGGLLAGTLIGSLLSGNGFGGGGFLDIIIFGLLIYLALKLFGRMRQRAVDQQSAYAPPSYDQAPPTFDQTSRPMYRESASGWDRLRSDGGVSTPSGPQPNIPAGFDTEEFLRGAKMAYTRLQNSWDNRDMADIEEFATPAVMEVLKEQLAESPEPSRTELILVNAQLLGVETDGDSQRAEVYFDVLMREDPRQQTPSSVREIWHFVQPLSGGHWRLDGIQQVS